MVRIQHPTTLNCESVFFLPQIRAGSIRCVSTINERAKRYLMNWTEGPATWKQLRYLNQLGYKPDHALTKAEAVELIRQRGGRPELFTSLETDVPRPSPQTAGELRSRVGLAKLGVSQATVAELDRAQQTLATAQTERQSFWVETCRDSGKALTNSTQVLELYRQYGCRFSTPLPKQVQYILDALDAALPSWDAQHPELFFQTLELNFPELLKRRCA